MEVEDLLEGTTCIHMAEATRTSNVVEENVSGFPFQQADGVEDDQEGTGLVHDGA